MAEELQLTEEQKKLILDTWNSRPSNPPSIAELTQLIFKEEKDGRSKEGILIKTFLSERQLRAHTSKEWQKIDIELTEENKEFIAQNASVMKPIEMSRVIFNNSNIMPLSKENQIVAAYMKTLPPTVLLNNQEEVDNAQLDKFRPPLKESETLKRLTKFTIVDYNLEKLTLNQKNDLKALMRYLHDFRFNHCINNFDTQEKRDLFEASFIGYVFDKSDLSPEDLHGYINLALDVVSLSDTQRRIDQLSEMINQNIEGEEGGRIAMGLAETLKHFTTEYNQNKARQLKIAESLQGKRADRIKENQSSTASLLNLVALWKDEKERKKMLEYAKMREQSLGEEVDKLAEMDELKAKIFGISKEEIVQFDEEE